MRRLSKRDDSALATLRELSVQLPLLSVSAASTVVSSTTGSAKAGHIFADSVVVDSSVTATVAAVDAYKAINFARASRRTFTDTDDAHILQAVRTAQSEGKEVVWKEVGVVLNRTGQACKQRWVLSLAPRHPELK